MCYIFKSLKSNRILNPGDTIALGVPIFTPYLEMAHLEDYDLHFVEVHAKQENRFQYTDEELEEAARPEGQGVLRRQPGQPLRRGAVARDDREDRRGPQEAAGPDPADRRRLRHVRAGLPLADGRVPEEHHRRLLLQQVLRLHRLAPRHDRGPRGQHLRRDDRQRIPSRSRSCWTSATAGSRSSRASSRSSTASSPTAATSR